MRRQLILGLAGAILALSVASLGGCGGGGGKKVFITVNGSDISEEDFLKAVEFQNMVVGADQQGRPIQQQVGQVAMKSLLRGQLILEIAKKKNLAPTDQEVNSEIERQKRLVPNLTENLQGMGRTLDDFRREARVSLALFKVVAKEVTPPTDKEINDVYQLLKRGPNRTLVYIPTSVQLKVIATTKEANYKRAQDELKRGVDFSQVSKLYTERPEIVNDPLGAGTWRTPNGQLDWYYPDLQAIGPDAVQAIKAAPAGSTTKWIINKQAAQTFYVIFKVEKRTTETVKPLNDDIKEVIRRDLISQKADTDKFNKELDAMRRNAKIEIKREPYKSLWANALAREKLVESNKTPAQPTPGGAPTAAPSAAPK